MYSRFTPGPDGSYRRKQVEPQRAEPEAPAPALPAAPQKLSPSPQGLRAGLAALLPKEMELGDVLVLLISLLLLVDAEEDFQSILITAAAFFLL